MHSLLLRISISYLNQLIGVIAGKPDTDLRTISDCLILSVVVFEEGIVVVVCHFFFSNYGNSYKPFPDENYLF